MQTYRCQVGYTNLLHNNVHTSQQRLPKTAPTYPHILSTRRLFSYSINQLSVDALSPQRKLLEA